MISNINEISKSKFHFTVVTICSIGHSEVWKHTSKLMVAFFNASAFKVYVPEKEVPEFLRITPPQIEVLTQESLGVAYIERLRNIVLQQNNEMRFGWYLQQFHKIQAIQNVDTEGVLIWDADCVPLREMKFFENSGAPVYMVASREMHQPYFDLIEQVLGLKRIQDHSFVIPGFPMKTKWVEEFISELSAPQEGFWYEKLLTSIDFSLQSGFSETETLGTWVANRKFNEWKKTSMNWERFGQSRFGYAKSFNSRELIELGSVNQLDIISFENWDKRGLHKLGKSILMKIRRGIEK
jgi:hypothetical protein